MASSDYDLRSVAVLEMELLLGGGALPPEYEGVEIGEPGPVIKDLKGDRAIYRVLPLHKEEKYIGEVRMAVGEYLPQPLLEVVECDSRFYDELDVLPLKWLERIRKALPRYRTFNPADPSLIAYSYPKLGLKYRDGDEELVLDLGTGQPVPRLDDLEDGAADHFASWSFLDHFRLRAEAEKVDPEEEFKSRLVFWHYNYLVNQQVPAERSYRLNRRLALAVTSSDVCVASHVPGLRPQKKSFYCVPASMQMLLESEGHAVTQAYIEYPHKLGLVANEGLPEGKIWRIGKCLKELSSGELNPERHEVVGGRLSETIWGRLFQCLVGRSAKPFISMIKGHCRLAYGVARCEGSLDGVPIQTRGMRLLDPEPVDVGCHRVFENEAHMTFLDQFTI